MTTVRELHDKSAELAQAAMVARHEGREEEAKSLARQALEYELQAAGLVPKEQASEPTRSILYLSAASLAYQCKDLQTAQRLVAEGLSGYPPPKVEEDLQDLFEQVAQELQSDIEYAPEIEEAGREVGRAAVSARDNTRRVNVHLRDIHAAK